MSEIASTRNPRVRELVALHRARGRRASGTHLVEGPHAVAEALAAGVVRELLGTAEGLAAFADEIGGPPQVRTTIVTDHVLDRVADATTPQGVLAVAASRTAQLADVVGAGLLVVLHEVADPGNAGTILRTADAAGASGVVLTRGSVDVFGPKAIRAAAGSTYHLPIVTDVSAAVVADACRAAGQRTLALDGAASSSVLDLPPGGGPLALVLGNEAHGVPPGVQELLDGAVAVPLFGRAESLNVAAAAAVALYAATVAARQPD